MRLARVFAAVFLVLLISGCSKSNYTWGWYAVWPGNDTGLSNLEFMVGGFMSTIWLSIVATTLSVLLGLLVALPGLSDKFVLRAVNRCYVEVFRSIPILVMLLWVYYGLPVVLDITLGPFAAGVIALVLCDSAFEAEIFRAGIQSIERGQIEAAKSIGLTYLDTMWFVVMPQAIRRVLPPLGNQFVYVLKMSSLVSVIGYMDLTRRANELTVTEYRPLEIYTVLVLEYLVLILVVSHLVRRLEKKMKVD